MAKVIVFREELLPSNETFICNQVNSVKIHTVEYVGLEPAEQSLWLNRPTTLLSNYRSYRSHWRAQLYRLIPVAPEFHSAVKRIQPDLIHAHFSQNATTILKFCVSHKLPLVVTLHGSFETVPNLKLVRGLGSTSYILRKKALQRYTSQFLCVSEFVRQRAIRLGYPAAKLQVHYTGVDTKYFSPGMDHNPEAQTILFAGRLAEKKGCEYFLRAMKIVRSRFPKVRATVVGGGELRGRLEALNADLGRVAEFVGKQSSEYIRNAMGHASLFCAPSITASTGDVEGLPTVLCEAQSMGLPTVSTFHAGIPEIVDNQKTGLLADERDHEMLARHMIFILENKRISTNFAHAARHRVMTSFDLEQQTRKLEDLYTKVLCERQAKD